MSRWVSLAVLLAIIAVTAVVLYKVMAAFLLPLFLASVLTVIFRPVHQAVGARLKGKDGLAALLTTAIILLTVLAPLATVATFAVREALGAVGGDVLEQIDHQVSATRRWLGLEIPFGALKHRQNEPPTGLADIDKLIRSLPDVLPSDRDLNADEQELLMQARDAINRLRSDVVDTAHVVEQAKKNASPGGEPSVEFRRVEDMLRVHAPEDEAHPVQAAVQRLTEIQFTLEQASRLAALGREAWENSLGVAGPTNDDPETDAGDAAANASPVAAGRVEVDPATGKLSLDGPFNYSELRKRFARLKATYEAFRIDLLGGPIWAWATDLANPGAVQLDQFAGSIQRYLRSWLPSVAGQATAIFGELILGLGIITLATFYFLKDGPAMISTLMKLSPLDDRYEEELLLEFDRVSRAVVLATLLSAVAQGLLAGIAYYFANFDSKFLLTALTIIFALVPFVGAAAVWAPAALWLIFIEGHTVAGVVMLVYCFVVVSMVDNLIKPYVLHGQSKLHPLLALLSVLGGVQALGPIGILVGPMVVSFLQALLNILHHELQSFDEGQGQPAGDTLTLPAKELPAVAVAAAGSPAPSPSLPRSAAAEDSPAPPGSNS